MSLPTQHGENVAGDIQTEDAYGQFDVMTPADVWLILDNLHTHFLDNNQDQREDVMKILKAGMKQLEAIDDELPVM